MKYSEVIYIVSLTDMKYSEVIYLVSLTDMKYSDTWQVQQTLCTWTGWSVR